MKIIIFISSFFAALIFTAVIGRTLSKNLNDDLEENINFKKTEHWFQLEVQNTILCWLFAVICGAVSVYVFT